MIRPIQYIDYDRISDDVLFLGGNTILRFVVALSRKDSNGNRYHCHKEYMYNTSYSLDDKRISVKRSFDYYLTLEKTDAKDSSIMIRAQDMIYIQSQLQQVIQWFNDGTYGTKRGKLLIVNKKRPILIQNLPAGKSIMLEPVVIQWENNNTSECGVRMTLSESHIYTDISIDRFYGFVYTMNTFNMYQSAQLMLNYMQRPEFGTNLHEFENMQLTGSNENLAGVSKGKEGRYIPNQKKSKSYFDKIDDL